MMSNVQYRLKRRLWVAVAALVLAWIVTPALAAGPVFWDWPAERDFSEMSLVGTATDSEGHLVAGFSAKALGIEGPEVFWAAADDGHGGAYLATGHGGEVHHYAANGESHLVARLADTEIFSLLVLPDGDILAGSGGGGHLFRINNRGESKVVGSISGDYIWAMALAPDNDVVWLATGSPATVSTYRLKTGEITEVASLAAENTLAILPRPDGSVLAATQGPGLVYRCLNAGETHLLYETDQEEASQFVLGPRGEIYLLSLRSSGQETSPATKQVTDTIGADPNVLVTLLGNSEATEVTPAALYRLNDDAVTLWWSGDLDLMTVAWSEKTGWLAGGPLAQDDGHSVLYGLTPPHGAHKAATWVGGDILDITIPDGGLGDVLVCEAHPGGVFSLAISGARERVAVSRPLDGGQLVNWGHLLWQGVEGGKPLKWSVRGGNRAQPDGSWTAWSHSWSESDHALELQPCRFMQWRVTFPPSAIAGQGSQVTGVTVSAWQDNLPPTLANFRLEILQGVHVGGMLSGRENITQRFGNGLQAEFSRDLGEDSWPGPEQRSLGQSVRVFSWDGDDPNGDRLVYRLAYRRRGDAGWRPVSMQNVGVYDTRETLAGWDTANVPDGQYDVRVVASDRRDNPAGLAKEAMAQWGPLTVDNTPPMISDFALEGTAQGFRVRCSVQDAASSLGSARIILPDGTFERLDPTDLICDSQREEFATEVLWPRPEVLPGLPPWHVRVEVRDLGGNLAVTEGEVPQ